MPTHQTKENHVNKIMIIFMVRIDKVKKNVIINRKKVQNAKATFVILS